MTWGIRAKWGRYEALRITKETAKTLSFIDAGWGGRETRADKASFHEWRGDEETARQLVAKLISARAEYDRRTAAATKWFQDRREEIFVSAKAIEAQRAETTKMGSVACDESAVGEADLPKE